MELFRFGVAQIWSCSDTELLRSGVAQICCCSDLELLRYGVTSGKTLPENACVYHTYPDGIYKGVLFLQVLRHSGMPGARWLRTLMLDDRITAERDLPTLAHIHITWELSNGTEAGTPSQTSSVRASRDRAGCVRF